MAMRRITVGVIGTGWIGEIRAKVCAAHPLVESLHLAEIDPVKLARVAHEIGAKTATAEYQELLRRTDIDAVFVCTTPETTHYPITRDCLLARKHTLLEKPMGLALKEADDLTLDAAKMVDIGDHALADPADHRRVQRQAARRDVLGLARELPPVLQHEAAKQVHPHALVAPAVVVLRQSGLLCGRFAHFPLVPQGRSTHADGVARILGLRLTDRDGLLLSVTRA